MNSISATISLYDNMAPVLQNITNAMNTVISAASGIEDATGKMFNESDIASARAELEEAGASLFQMKNDIENNAIRQNEFNDSLTSSNTLANSLISTIKRLAFTYMGIQGVKLFVGTADEMSQITARLESINDSFASSLEFQDAIFESAQRSRGEYKQTMDIVARLGSQAKKAFDNNRETILFAENLNKLFAISGTSAQGVESVMYNLTQAMASGVLRGQDLNAVISNTPQLMEIVAKHMGRNIEDIREMAQEGQLSASVIKDALLGATKVIDDQFRDMPKTMHQVGNEIKNNFIKAMEPAFASFTNFINTKEFESFINNTVSVIRLGSSLIVGSIEFVVRSLNSLYEWFDVLKVPIFVLIGLFAAYEVATGLTALSSFAAAVASQGLFGAISSLIGAQWGLNTALLASPIFWIPAVIIGIIGLLYLVVGIINRVRDTSVSATGIIVGVIAVGMAIIANEIIGNINFIISMGITLRNLIARFANFFANVFNHPVAAIKNLFVGLFNTILDIVQSAASVIDVLLGSNISAAVGNFQNKVNKWVSEKAPNPEGYKNVLDEINPNDYKLQRIEYGKAAKWGYEQGQNIVNGIKDKFSLKNLGQNQLPEGLDLSKYANGALDNFSKDDKDGKGKKNHGKDIKKDTKDIKDKLNDGIEMKNEDLTYLRELASQRAINNISLDKVVVDVKNSFGDVYENADLDGWTESINTGLSEAVYNSVEGLGDFN